VRDIIATGDLAHRLAQLVTAANRLPLLMLGQLRPAAHLDAARFRPLAALASARPDKVALKLCEAAQHRQHQWPV
jgi:hypothetical protein